MGGDLNLKKSWHVGLQKNQTKVWQAEEAALAERKKVAQIQAERQEERAIEELHRLQAESGVGGKALINPKVAWMYSGSTSGVNGTSEEQESYLLGKRTVHSLLQKNDEARQLAKPAGPKEVSAATALNAREIQVKAGLDPLLAIQRQKQASLTEAMSTPMGRKMLMKQLKAEEKKKERKGRRDEDEDRHRSKRRRHSDESDNQSRKHRSHRRKSETRSRSRSRSPHHRLREEDRPRSIHSSRRNEHEDRKRSDRRSRSRSRSRSPYHRSKRDDRSRSPYQRKREDTRSPPRRSSPRRERREHGRPSPDRSARPAAATTNTRNIKAEPSSTSNAEAERAAKLAAMQSSAAELEETRNRRLAEMEARDVVEREREDKQRADKSNRFKGGLHKQAAGIGLEGRVKRSRGGLERLEGTF